MKKLITLVLMVAFLTVCMTSNVSAATKLHNGSFTVQTKSDASFNYFKMSIVVKNNKITKATFQFMNEALGSEVTSDILSIVPEDQQATFKQMIKDVKYYNDQFSKKKNGDSVNKSKKDKSGIYKQFQNLWKQVISKASKSNQSPTVTPTPAPLNYVDGTYVEKTTVDASYNYFQMSITVKDGKITTTSFQFMNDALGSEVTKDLWSLYQRFVLLFCLIQSLIHWQAVAISILVILIIKPLVTKTIHKTNSIILLRLYLSRK